MYKTDTGLRTNTDLRSIGYQLYKLEIMCIYLWKR